MRSDTDANLNSNPFRLGLEGGSRRLLPIVPKEAQRHIFDSVEQTIFIESSSCASRCINVHPGLYKLHTRSLMHVASKPMGSIPKLPFQRRRDMALLNFAKCDPPMSRCENRTT